ncbi:hypothetical protein [Herbaspirillum frisingense]|nr:hypothetical protein [Herbaspirillum frisingense]
MSNHPQPNIHQEKQQFGKNELQLALQRGEFEPYFQPIIGAGGAGAELKY